MFNFFEIKRFIAAMTLFTTISSADMICYDMGDATWCQDIDTGQETWIYK